ncbi:MAG TPA: molybdopterin-dependent oxidoreductase [Casimicrobiaceae bacterium]|nr:molybdopterin-dependent oxidoreductase [Casimicrobiaceae bacterium]
MNKRTFVAALLAGAALPAAAAQVGNRPRSSTSGPGLLTITGAIGKTNRGPFDPAADILMAKHKLEFTRAFAIDWAMLAKLHARTIEPTLEYDNKPHKLSGPLLLEVLELARVGAPESAMLALRAIDGYAPTISIAEARKLGFIVATHRDGAPLHVGGLGPLWAVYDADRNAEAAAKPVAERFAKCPWGLYHIEVRA